MHFFQLFSQIRTGLRRFNEKIRGVRHKKDIKTALNG
jgi:hypothetical protein